MATKIYKSEDLKIGCLIRDVISGDLGLLVYRHNVMRDSPEHEPVWVWDMHWTGPATDYENKNVPFVEVGVLTLLNGGSWEMEHHGTDE